MKLLRTLGRSSLFRASASYAVASMAAYALSLVKSAIVARYFGTTAAVDAFNIATIVPNLAATLLAGSSAAALVPALSRAEKEGIAERARLFRSGFVIFTITSSVLVILLWLAARPVVQILASRFPPEEQALTAHLLRLAAPVLLFAAIAAYCSGELLYRRRYLLVAGTPALVTLSSIVLLLTWSRIGISILAIGLVVGTAIQAFIVGFAAWRSYPPSRGGIRLWTPPVRALLAEQGVLILVASIGVINAFVDQAVAAFLPAGTVAALNFANAFNSAVIQITVMATSWVVFPDFSDLFASGDLRDVRDRAIRVLTILAAAAGVITAVILGAGDVVIRCLFQHGRFDSNSTALVFRLWCGYSLGLVPFAIGMIAARLLSAGGKNRMLAWIGAVALVLNVGLDFLLMRWLGPMGISLATSLVYVITASLNVLAVQKVFGIKIGKEALKNAALPVFGSALSVAAFQVLRVQLGNTLGLVLGTAIWMAIAFSIVRSRVMERATVPQRSF